MNLTSSHRTVIGIAFSFAVAGASVAACSSTSSTASPPPCNENPWECPAGQTCWIKDNNLAFGCLNSSSAKKGDACQNAVATPTCGDGLTCFQMQGTAGGTCVPFCDETNPAHGCSSGETCASVIIQSQSGLRSGAFHVCVSPGPVFDGGPGTDSATTDAPNAFDAPADTTPVDDGSADAGPDAPSGD